MTGFLVPNTPRKRKSIDEIIAEAEDLPKTDGKNDPLKDIVPPNNNSDKEIKDSNFDIVEVDDYFRISGINYRNNLCVYDFSKNLLPEKSQDAHAEDAKRAKSDVFVACSAPLVYSICKTLYENKDCDKKVLVKNAKNTLNEFFKKNLLNTLSQVFYETSGQGKVVHDYKQKTQYELSGQLVGYCGYITNSNTKANSLVHAVFDTKDSMNYVNNVFKWITNKESYVWRVNDNLSDKEERVVDFGADSDNFVIGIFNDSFNVDAFSNKVRPALGVRLHKILKEGTK